MSNAEKNRLEAVVGHWLPRMAVAGIMPADAMRLVNEAGEWPQWCATWCAEGERQVALADESREAGRLITAGEAYLRAALYFHFAQFMFFEDQEQKSRAARRKVEVYTLAAPFLQPPALRISVPFAGGELYGYLRRPHAENVPVVVLVPGSDSTKEEFPALEDHFLRRGMATFSIDGPGQGEGRGLGALTPHWEPPLLAIAETLRGKQGFNGRIGLMGMAFGCHLVLQGAGALPGLDALVCMNGFYDMGSFWDDLPEVYRANMRHTLGGETIQDTRELAKGFTLRDVAPPVCPTLVVHGGRDRIFPPEDARRIVSHVGKVAESVEYPDGNHVCNNIAYRYRPLIADWMAEQLGGRVVPIG